MQEIDDELSGLVGHDPSGQNTALDFLRENEDSLALRSGPSGVSAGNNSKRGAGNKLSHTN